MLRLLILGQEHPILPLQMQVLLSAYGMVPIAGDEMTEAISDEFLLDFPFAEKAKRNSSRK